MLLDIPRLHGTEWLEPGSHVTAGDLAAAEARQGVRVGAGDILLVRVGHRRRREELGAWDATAARAGLHPTALRHAADRRVAVLGSDGNNDTAPSAVRGVAYPVHVLAIHAMGLHLLDYLRLEELARLCADEGRWSFLCVIAPLRLPHGDRFPRQSAGGPVTGGAPAEPTRRATRAGLRCRCERSGCERTQLT